MKKTDIKKIKDMGLKGMEKELAEARDYLRTLRFDLAAGKVKNVRLINETKKKIARLMTFINQNTKIKGQNETQKSDDKNK